jgi:pyruvate dehydrogenase E2 component (dihydrolipoamide acetyltransferase)
MSRSSMEPVWNGSEFEPRLMLPLSLSYDHRVINGADGARFLRWVAQALEQPFLLSLEG